MKSLFAITKHDQGVTLNLEIGREDPILGPMEFSKTDLAEATIIAIRKANKAKRYFILDNCKGKFFIEMRDAKGNVIATSHSYTSRYNAQKGIQVLEKYIPMAQTAIFSKEYRDV